MRHNLKVFALASLVVGVATPLSAQDRVERQEREPSRRRTVWVSRDDDRPRLGVSTSSGSRRDTLGLLITGVSEDGAAAKAGVEEGDRLASINGVNLRLSPQDAGEEDMSDVAQRRLIRELQKHKAGEEVELRVWSNGQFKTVKAKLTEPDDERGLGTTLRAMREERDKRAVIGIGLGMSGSRRDTLGILVSSVAEEGPAGKAGIEEGDRVAAINGVDLRVSKEDAGDASAANARIRRLNREMEKVKPGDVVDLRVYRDGQTKSVKVTSVKAADLPESGNAFFFGDGAGMTMPGMPRAPDAPMPPSPPLRFRFDDDGELRFKMDPRSRIEMEEGIRRGMLDFRRAMPKMRMRVDSDEEDAVPPAVDRSRTRSRSGPRIAMAGDAAMAAISDAGGPLEIGPAVDVWHGDDDEGMIWVNGLKLTKVGGDLASYFGDGSERGLLVLGAGAEWDGVRAGDVLLRVDGRAVRDGDAVNVQVRGRDAHDVELIRGGKRLSLRVPLDSGPR
jgi:S1-C subfamily serine protease